MDQPNSGQGGQGGQSGDSSKSSQKAPAVKVLEVVEYTRRDLITGNDATHVGVVIRADKGDQTVAVRPLAHYHHEVDPADVTVLSADDVS